MTRHWNFVDPAPYDKVVEVRTYRGKQFRAQFKRDASMTEDEQPCDQWQAEEGARCPRDWSGGCCWESNADGIASDHVVAWRPENICAGDGKPCANPDCKPGYCFPNSSARNGGAA